MQFAVAECQSTHFISRTRVSQHRRLKTLHECLVDIDCDDEAKCSAAKAAYVECDLIIKMHQQLVGEKLLPMRLERAHLEKIIQQSE